MNCLILFLSGEIRFFLNAWLQLIPEVKLGNIENTECKKAFLFPSRRNAFVYSVSLGVMIFFAASEPEGNCHEKCQQLGDGNGKPDTVRAVFFVDGFAVPVYGKGYVMKYGDKYRLFSILTTDSANEMVKKAADRIAAASVK